MKEYKVKCGSLAQLLVRACLCEMPAVYTPILSGPVWSCCSLHPCFILPQSDPWVLLVEAALATRAAFAECIAEAQVSSVTFMLIPQSYTNTRLKL